MYIFSARYFSEGNETEITSAIDDTDIPTVVNRAIEFVREHGEYVDGSLEIWGVTVDE